MTLVSRVKGGNKSVDRPRRATDEEPVDVRKRGERPGITWIDAAAVENRNLGTGPSEQVFTSGPNQCGNRFHVLRAGWSAAGADRPDRLIGNLNLSQLFRLRAVQADAQLPQYRLPADAEGSFLRCLAHGEEDAQASAERRQHFAVELDVGFVEVATSLGMSQQDQIDIESTQHT